MLTFKRLLALALSLALAVPAVTAPPYGGGAARDHGHTAPGDGGVLSNPTVTGMSVIKTGAFSGAALDPVLFSSGTTNGTATSVPVASYNLINAGRSTVAGSGHFIGTLGRAISNDSAMQQHLLGVEGRSDTVSTSASHWARDVTGLGIFNAAVGSVSSTMIGGLFQSQIFNGDLATPLALGTGVGVYINTPIGGAVNYGILQQGASALNYFSGPIYPTGGMTTTGAQITISTNVTITGKLLTTGMPFVTTSSTGGAIVPSGSNTCLQFSDVIDRAGNMGLNYFTAPVTGYYSIYFRYSAQYASGATCKFNVGIFKNSDCASSFTNLLAYHSKQPTFASTYEEFEIPWTGQLSAGDTVAVAVNQTGCTTPLMNWSDNTNGGFGIHVSFVP